MSTSVPFVPTIPSVYQSNLYQILLGQAISASHHLLTHSNPLQRDIRQEDFVHVTVSAHSKAPGQLSITQTAAGFPVKESQTKAFTVYCSIR